jgi:hypothetical protein
MLRIESGGRVLSMSLVFSRRVLYLLGYKVQLATLPHTQQRHGYII